MVCGAFRHMADADPSSFRIPPDRLFGPKRKMTSAIARWHSSARPPSDALELAYADRLEAEMQELAIQLHKVGGGHGVGGHVQKWQER